MSFPHVFGTVDEPFYDNQTHAVALDGDSWIANFHFIVGGIHY